MKKRTKIRLLAALLAAMLMASQCVTVFAEPAGAEADAAAETVMTPETEAGDTNADETVPGEAGDTSGEDQQEPEEASDEDNINEAAPTEEETLTSSEGEEAPGSDASEEEIMEYLTSNSSENGRLTGHLPMPGEHEDPAVADYSLDYNSMKAALNDTRTDEECRGATQRAQGATAKSKAFPYSWQDEDEILGYLTDNYPLPREQSGGTCWAHAAIANSEFYMITHGMAESDVDFSEKHLGYWAYTQGTPSLAGDTGDTIACTGTGSFGDDEEEILDLYGIGGNAYMAALTLMQWRGIADESDVGDSWDVELSEAGERNDVAHLKNAYQINRSNTSLVKDVILKTGLVGVSIAAYGEFVNRETASFYCPFNTYTNHDVAIVGWDDDYPRDRFDSYGGRKPSKNGAWLVRNSWDTEAEIDFNSYFWMSYEDKAMNNFWAFEATDSDYDNNYFYDSQIHLPSRANAVKSANIYQANGDEDFESLEAVSFDLCYISSTNVKYTIEVYTGVDPDRGPESGTKIDTATTTGTVSLSGMYTIPLENPVTLENGEYYSIVITLSDKKSVNYEADGLGEDEYGWDGISQGVGIQEGQSFIYQNKKWIDLSDSPVDSTWVYRDWYYSETVTVHRGNLAIHALTNNGPAEGTLVLSTKELTFDSTNKVGDSKEITVDVNSEGLDIRWVSDDQTVATVDEDGHVYAVGNGTATITGYAGISKATCTVTVNLTKHTVTLAAGGGILTYVEDDGGPVYVRSRTIKVPNGGTFRVEEPKRANCDFEGWVDEDEQDFVPGTTTVEEDMTIKAVWNKKLTADPPMAEPDPDLGDELHYGDTVCLLATDPSDAKILYTLNGSDPDENSQLYEEPIPVTEKAGTLTIRAIAVRDGYNNSSIADFSYTITRDIDAEWGDIIDTDKAQIGKDTEEGPINIPNGLWVSEASCNKTAVYTGSPVIFPSLRVYFRNRRLRSGIDYTVAYSNNVNASENAAANKMPTATVKGKGNFTGQDQIVFRIQKVALPAPEESVILAAETGKAIKPVPVIYYENPVTGVKTQLKNNTDFKCEYTGSDFKSPGVHTIKVTGNGNFTGNLDVTLNIIAKANCISIAKATLKNFSAGIPLSADPDVDEYIQDTMTVHLTKNGEALVEDDDYTVNYINNKSAGTATMIITGKAPYTGSLTKTFKITQLPINNAVINGFEPSIPWSEDTMLVGIVKQDITLTYDGFELVPGRDYTLSYKNNQKTGKATMTVTGMGRFSGSLSKPFTIQAYNIQEDSGDRIRILQYDSFGYEHEPDEYTVDGFDGHTLAVGGQPLSAGAKLVLEIYYDEDGDGNSVELTPGIDYTITYAKNKPKTSRKGKVTITGKGAFTGKISADFWISGDGLINMGTTFVHAPDLVRSPKKNGLFSTPEVYWNNEKLKAGADYSKKYRYTYAKDAELTNGIRKAGTEVRPEDILREGTSAEIKVEVYDTWYDKYQVKNTSAYWIYSVKAGSLSKAKVTVNGGQPYDYSAGFICPGKDDLVVKIGDTTLKKTDYEIGRYYNNYGVGNATIYIYGIGDYTGATSAKFRIGPRKFLWWPID